MAIIHPEIFVTPDHPTVQIRESRDSTELKTLLNQVLRAQGWGLGTYFHVQFISHDRTRLLSQARFVVCGIDESLQTSEANPYQPVTRAVTTRRYRQMGDWMLFDEPSDALRKKWNPGKLKFEICQGEDVVATVDTKEEATAIVEGRMPLPAKQEAA